LLFLSACNSVAIAEAAVHRLGLARAAIGVDGDVLDRRSLTFMKCFYACLMYGEPLRKSFELALSSHTSSSVIMLQGSGSGTSSGLGAALTQPCSFQLTAVDEATLKKPLFPPAARRNFIRNVPASWRDLRILDEHEQWRRIERASVGDLLKQPPVTPRTVLLIGDEPGVGSSTLALQALQFAVERAEYLTAGAYWVPSQPHSLARQAWHPMEALRLYKLEREAHAHGHAQEETSDLELLRVIFPRESALTLQNVSPGPLWQRVAAALGVAAAEAVDIIRFLRGDVELPSTTADDTVCRMSGHALLVFDDCELCSCIDRIDEAAEFDPSASAAVDAPMLARNVAVPSACELADDCPIRFMHFVHGTTASATAAHAATLPSAPQLGSQASSSVSAAATVLRPAARVTHPTAYMQQCRVSCMIVCNHKPSNRSAELLNLKSVSSTDGGASSSSSSAAEASDQEATAPTASSTTIMTADGPLSIPTVSASAHVNHVSAFVHRVHRLHPFMAVEALVNLLEPLGAVAAPPTGASDGTADTRAKTVALRGTKDEFNAALAKQAPIMFDMRTAMEDAPFTGAQAERYGRFTVLALTEGNAKAITLMRALLWLAAPYPGIALADLSVPGAKICRDVALRAVPAAVGVRTPSALSPGPSGLQTQQSTSTGASATTAVSPHTPMTPITPITPLSPYRSEGPNAMPVPMQQYAMPMPSPPSTSTSAMPFLTADVSAFGAAVSNVPIDAGPMDGPLGDLSPDSTSSTPIAALPPSQQQAPTMPPLPPGWVETEVRTAQELAVLCKRDYIHTVTAVPTWFDISPESNGGRKWAESLLAPYLHARMSGVAVFRSCSLKVPDTFTISYTMQTPLRKGQAPDVAPIHVEHSLLQLNRSSSGSEGGAGGAGGAGSAAEVAASLVSQWIHHATKEVRLEPFETLPSAEALLFPAKASTSIDEVAESKDSGAATTAATATATAEADPATTAAAATSAAAAPASATGGGVDPAGAPGLLQGSGSNRGSQIQALLIPYMRLRVILKRSADR
jgi:hypothetical protein